MESVAKKLEEVTSNLTRMNEDALKSMADGFGEKLQGAAGEQVKALATVLQDLKLSLDGISTRMNSSGEELADRIRQSSDEMRAAVSAMAGAINEIAAKVAVLHAATRRLIGSSTPRAKLWPNSRRRSQLVSNCVN